MPDGLLLLHAFPLDSRMWKPQIEALRGTVPVAAPEFPGFGKTPTNQFPPTMDGAADAALAALDEAGIERAVVCGLSMGGYVAMAFWRRHPARVAGLLLANTRADADDAAAKERRKALASRLRKDGVGFLAASPPPLLSEQANPSLLKIVKATIADQSAEAIASAAEAMAARPDSSRDLAKAKVPALVITSDHDTLIAPSISKVMAEGIPGAQFEIVAGAGHLSNLERPQEFNELLRGHLEACAVLRPTPGKPTAR